MYKTINNANDTAGNHKNTKNTWRHQSQQSASSHPPHLLPSVYTTRFMQSECVEQCMGATNPSTTEANRGQQRPITT